MVGGRESDEKFIIMHGGGDPPVSKGDLQLFLHFTDNVAQYGGELHKLKRSRVLYDSIQKALILY